MKRRTLSTALASLFLAGPAAAQDVPEKAKPAAVALLEDNAESFDTWLDNHGAADASRLEPIDRGAFSGKTALSVTPFQRFRSRLVGWKYRIEKDPQVGEYRYLRFAWKRSEADGIMLQLHTASNQWHRYYAGTLSEQTQAWGAMTRVADGVPRNWDVVTRDLFEDFGPMTITGIGFSALEGDGAAYFDHIYLGKTLEDLERITAEKKNALADAENVAAPAFGGSRVWVLAITIIVMILAAFAWLAFRRKRAASPV